MKWKQTVLFTAIVAIAAYAVLAQLRSNLKTVFDKVNVELAKDMPADTRPATTEEKQLRGLLRNAFALGDPLEIPGPWKDPAVREALLRNCGAITDSDVQALCAIHTLQVVASPK